ncbi:MAG: GSCFA domain-containing protein, partial [Bacteroidaceae bacterium]|nr:GSCFA domain-containing protein [Bacteroidaceae bacterium]
MDFRTPVELPKGLPLITHNGQILLIGSCFADNIGNLLAEYKFPVDINPYGILYNPLSIS